MDTPARRGFTLIEILVVLVLLGIGTAPVARRCWRRRVPPDRTRWSAPGARRSSAPSR